MDALVRLVGSVLSWLHGAVAPDVCPGGWAWATTVFGVLVGLLPTAGALAVAALRRRRGPERPLGGLVVTAIALTSCGVLPWLAFRATGAVFGGVGRNGQGLAALGLAAADRASLLAPTCLGISERAYLGTVSVSATLNRSDLLGALLVVPLVVFPILAALSVLVQGRTALRRGSARPARFFWLPMVATALLSGQLPAGATAQLWAGMLVAVAAGVFMVPLVPAPARAPASGAPRSAGRPRPPSARSAMPPPAGRSTPPAASGSERPRPLRQVLPGFSVPARSVPPAASASAPVTPEAAQFAEVWAAARARAAVAVRQAREVWVNGSWREWQARVEAALAPPAASGPPAAPAPGAPAPAASASGAPAPAARRPAASPRSGGSAAPAVPPIRSRPLAATPGRPVPAQGLPAPRLPPTLVGAPSGVDRRFELIRPLGTGGFGGVWLARDHQLGGQVAIKSALAPDHDTELRIRREARALSAVDHPHCVRILDLVETHTDPGLGQLRGLAIVMEYVDGCSLGDQVVERGTVDDVTAARIWLHTAGALHAAHRRGVLHRDVKPTNVVLDATGRPHLIDFGIARAPGDATLTTQGVVIGTPDFLAPEAARGEPASPAADAWGLAATVCWALTGRPPRGDHQDAVAGLRAAAASVGPTHLPERSAHRNLLRASLDDDPAARPGLPEVRDVLERWLARGESADRPDRPVTAARGRRAH